MLQKLSLGVLISAFVACTCVAPCRAAKTDAELQAILSSIQEAQELPGIAAALCTGEGEIISAAAGFAKLSPSVPLTPNAEFFVGSISKTYFGVITLQLVQEGRLSLDDPIAQYVDWPRGEEITIRMLLDHSSGIQDYISVIDASPPDIIRVWYRRDRKQGEILQMMAQYPLLFEPGSQQSYSNTNAVLLGEVLKSVSGNSLAELLSERICLPIGLRQTYLYGETPAAAGLVHGYLEPGIWLADPPCRLADVSAADLSFPDAADGSVVSTVAEMVQFHRALRSGKLLSEPLWQEMRRVMPNRSNGLAYLVGEGKIGKYEGNLGRMTGTIAASLYFPEHDCYLALAVNCGSAALPIGDILDQWLDSKTSRSASD